MRLFEFESKRIFKAEGISVPRGDVVSSYEEAKRALSSIGLPVILKAQVPTGRRAKGGAIHVAESLDDVESVAKDILGKRIQGFEIHKLLVEEYLPVDRELYLSVTIDDSKGKPVVLVSSEGGTEIEEIAAKSPEKIVSLEIDPLSDFEQHEAGRIAKQIDLSRDSISKVSSVLWLLYQVFTKCDATIAEINPLIITKRGDLCAAGAVLAIDDDALYRHTELSIHAEERIQDDIEREAAKLSIHSEGIYSATLETTAGHSRNGSSRDFWGNNAKT